MILVFTGNGKGKTTAAIGQGIRVVGQGGKVLMVQFIKAENWATGEEKALKVLEPNFTLIKGGKGFVGIMGDNLPREVHEKAARDALQIAKKAIASGDYSLVVLDEINVAFSMKLIGLKDVLEILGSFPEDSDIILTGRGAPLEIIKKADLVTEFKEIKHPYDKGIQGKRGREY